MNIQRNTLARLLILVVMGCSNSHGMSGQDGGPDTPMDMRVGSDGGPIADGWAVDVLTDVSQHDSGPEVDSAVLSVDCAPNDASTIRCPDIVCDGPDQWYWNGHECFAIPCGTCIGEDCEGPSYIDQSSCNEAHLACPATQCGQSGGTWRFWGVNDCRFQCGVPDLGVDCDRSAPTCDCGPNMTFIDGECQREDTCLEELPRLPIDVLCTSTGGEWASICSHSQCGVPSGDPCVSDACHCPWPMNFDNARGCYEVERCFRGEGGCNEHSICPTGMACNDGQCDGVVCTF